MLAILQQVQRGRRSHVLELEAGLAWRRERRSLSVPTLRPHALPRGKTSPPPGFNPVFFHAFDSRAPCPSPRPRNRTWSMTGGRPVTTSRNPNRDPASIGGNGPGHPERDHRLGPGASGFPWELPRCISGAPPFPAPPRTSARGREAWGSKASSLFGAGPSRGASCADGPAQSLGCHRHAMRRASTSGGSRHAHPVSPMFENPVPRRPASRVPFPPLSRAHGPDAVPSRNGCIRRGCW